MTLASIDAETGRTVLVSLPRNLEDIPFPDSSPAHAALPHGWSCGDSCLLNGLYTWGHEHRSLYPGAADPGAAVMKDAVEGITGLKVNYYVLVDLAGFRDVIDAMGGITVTVNERVPIGGGSSKVSGYIEPGTQHLDGYHALWFARSRHGASDYARMQRQRCVMNAMVGQLDPATLLSRFQRIAAAGTRAMHTDLPASELATFVDLGTKAKSHKISSVQFVPPLINPARPDFTIIRDRVQAAVRTAQQERDAPPARKADPASVKAGTTGTATTGTTTTGTTGGSGTTGGTGSDAAAGGNGGTAGQPSPGPSGGTDISSACSAA
jgi:LCP family protein required for cell wall assembly